MVQDIQQQLQGLLVCIALGILGSSERQWQRLQRISMSESYPLKISCKCEHNCTIRLAVLSILMQLYYTTLMCLRNSSAPAYI